MSDEGLFQAIKFKAELVTCDKCKYYQPFDKNAKGYGKCIANHTFDGAFRDNDFCSYGIAKDKK